MIIWLNLLILVLVAGDLALLLAYYREVRDNQRLQANNDYLAAEVMQLHLQLRLEDIQVVRESEDGEG